MKVFIVEDDPVQREMLQYIMCQNGIEAKLSDGSEENLINLMCDYDPDVILLDLILPNTSGFEIASQISCKPNLTLTPVIVLSSVTNPALRVSLIKAGCMDFIEKPYKTEDLIKKIKCYVRLGDLTKKLYKLERKTR